MGEKLSGETEDEVNLNPEKQEQSSWLARFREIISRPIGRAYLVMLGLLAIGVGGDRPRITEQHQQAPSVTFHLKDSQIHFENWSNFDDQITDKQIDIKSSAIKSIIEEHDPANDPEEHEPGTVSDPKKFSQWVEHEIREPDVTEEVGVEDFNDLTPKQSVELAVAVVAKNLNYDPVTAKNLDSKDFMDQWSASSNLEKTTDKTPADVILEKHLPVVCRHFASCAAKVFDAIKQNHPKGLANLYCEVAKSSDLEHAWNVIIKVDSPKEADVSFIDPTGADHRWALRQYYKEDFMQLIYDLQERHLIDDGVAYGLAADYFTTNTTRVEEEWRFIDFAWSDSAWQKGKLAEILDHFIHRPSDELEKAEWATNHTEFMTYFAREKLRDLMVDPENFSRPDNWYEKAERLTSEMVAIDKKEGGAQVANLKKPIPKTPEQFYQMEYEKEVEDGRKNFQHGHFDAGDYQRMINHAQYGLNENLKKIPKIKQWTVQNHKEHVWWQ